MPHILSVSYHPSISQTRHLLLQQQGYRVTSALGFTEAVAQCERGGFDLLLLGHTVPRPDKEKLMDKFRRHCTAPVLSLLRSGESPLPGADYTAFSHDPHELLERVAAILSAD